jgi:hypothetical protein
MLLHRLAVICGVSLGAAGCAIHPLPQDVTGYDTAQIVAKIRCEAREAIRAYAIEFIDEYHKDIAAQLRDRSLMFRGLNRKILHPHVQKILEKYDEAAIAYDFTFDITETNNVTAGVDLLSTFTRGTVKTGFTAGNERDRQNVRNFQMTDSFENLISIVRDQYCPSEAGGPNWLYPITGTIGLDELIRTFVTLTETERLTGGGKDKVDPAVADTIEFRTKFSGSAHPKLELSPLGRGTELVSANLKGEVSRLDNHKVIVAVSLPPEKAAPRRARIEGAKDRASAAVEEQITRKYLIDRKRFDDSVRKLLPP